jgi:hypothetical protein
MSHIKTQQTVMRTIFNIYTDITVTVLSSTTTKALFPNY